jgi:hypothetical protein
VPIDNDIARWTLTTLPAGWEAVRDQWEWYHSLRTFACLLGLACTLGSVLFAEPTAQKSLQPGSRLSAGLEDDRDPGS